MIVRNSHFLKPGPGRGAFTLVEVLVSMTVLLVLLLVSAQVIGTVQSTWTTSNARVGQFREARVAFDIITRNLSQATLNSYVDFDKSWLEDDPAQNTMATTAPSKFERKSDLQFITGPAAGQGGLLVQGGDADLSPGHAVFFQAPLGVTNLSQYVGLDKLLCTRGYFVQYTTDDFFRPEVLPPAPPRYRYRLMEFSPPAEQNLIYDKNDLTGWRAQAGVRKASEDNDLLSRGLTRPIADNIIALIISPQWQSAQGAGGVQLDNSSNAYDSYYSFDSRTAGASLDDTNQGRQHRLPPLVRVVLVAIDERTADTLSQRGNPSTPPFGASISSLIGDGGGNIVNVTETLERISAELLDRKVNYRIFSATVALRGAK